MLKVMEFKLDLGRPRSCEESLERQPSTVSLPNKRVFQHVGGLKKARLSYSMKRIRRRTKNVDNSTEIETVSLSQLPDSYKDLKKIHSDFTQFLNVVVEDLTEKTEKLVKYKNSDSVTAHEKNFANLQVFMLTKYSSRIENFKTVASQRVEHICLAHNKNCSTDSVTNLVNKVRSSTYISGNCK